MWLKRQNPLEQVHVTCHSWELQTSLRIQSGTATWAGAKAWQYQILQAITNIVKQTLWRITDKISGLKGWKSLWRHCLQYILLNHGLLVWSSCRDLLYFKERITALQEITYTFRIQYYNFNKCLISTLLLHKDQETPSMSRQDHCGLTIVCLFQVLKVGFS